MMVCPCCGGAGEHEVRPFITASPYDRLTPCHYCNETGYVSTAKARRYGPHNRCKDRW